MDGSEADFYTVGEAARILKLTPGRIRELEGIAPQESGALALLGCDWPKGAADGAVCPLRCPRDIGATSEDCMEEAKPIPEAWIGQDVHVRYAEADEPRSINCEITEVNDRGLCVEGEGKTAFFPWGNIIKVEMGHLARRTKLGIR